MRCQKRNCIIYFSVSFEKLNRSNIFADHLNMNAGISKFSNNSDIFLSRLLGLLFSDQFIITFFGHSSLAFTAIGSIFLKFFTLKNN